MTVGEKLKALRIKKGITQDELASYLSTTKQTIYKYETGIITNIPLDKIERLAKKFNVSAAYLAGWDKKELSPTKDTYPFKIEGEVAAGFSTFPNDADSDVIEIPVEWLHGLSPDKFFVLRVVGESMAPDIVDGDLVLVKEENTVEPGTIAAVLYDSDYATLKKVNYDPTERWWMDLIPLNRDFDIMHVTGEDLNRCKVLGPVWKLIRDFE